MLGVVGGLGPVASTAFLRTLYERGTYATEQQAPAVLLYSDPRVPPRSELLLEGRGELLLQWLTDVLERLEQLGSSQIVICCVTIHHLLPQVPERLRSRVLSLLDVIFSALERTQRRHLMVASRGSYQLELFQRHPRAHLLEGRVVLPTEQDQLALYALINRVKVNADLEALARELEGYLERYDVRAFISGCTEIHLLARLPVFSEGNARGYTCIDPLTLIADEWTREVA